MGLCHTAAILSRETKVALFFLSSLAPNLFTAWSRVVKQSFFSLSRQYGRRVTKAYRLVSAFGAFLTLPSIIISKQGRGQF